MAQGPRVVITRQTRLSPRKSWCSYGSSQLRYLGLRLATSLLDSLDCPVASPTDSLDGRLEIIDRVAKIGATCFSRVGGWFLN